VTVASCRGEHEPCCIRCAQDAAAFSAAPLTGPNIGIALTGPNIGFALTGPNIGFAPALRLLDVTELQALMLEHTELGCAEPAW
jgi:hypothetical protein